MKVQVAKFSQKGKPLISGRKLENIIICSSDFYNATSLFLLQLICHSENFF